MLVDMGDMLRRARANGYAVGAFDPVSPDFLRAIIAGAENRRSPVILGLAESHDACSDLELLMPAVRVAAERASVPVVIHLTKAAPWRPPSAPRWSSASRAGGAPTGRTRS